jgi:hypothetical protein
MESLLIEATKYSPRVILNSTGVINIEGRSIVEDSIKFFEPILTWVKSCSSPSLNIDIKLEYINTSSSKQLFNMLKLVGGNFSASNVQVKWYYEEGDEDTLELGKEFESETMLPFVFLQFSETAA